MDDLELEAKKVISALVTSERYLIAQWKTFDVISAAIQKERMRFYFSMGDEKIARINNRMQDRVFARKKHSARKNLLLCRLASLTNQYSAGPVIGPPSAEVRYPSGSITKTAIIAPPFVGVT